MSGGLGIPRIDFSPLGKLGETFADGLRAADQRAAVQSLGLKPGDPGFLPKLGQVLIGQGDVNGALAVGRLIQADQDRTYQRQTDARDFSFRQQQAAREQGNADRSFGFQTSQAADSNKFRDRQQSLTEYYQGAQIRNMEENRKLQERQLTAKTYPAGFEADPENPGGQRFIRGGPQDPEVQRQQAEAKRKAENGAQNPFAPAGSTFNEGQGKAAGFADRMLQSEGVLSGVGDKAGIAGEIGTSRAARVSAIPLIGNQIAGSIDPRIQQYDQAKRDFVNAQLRRESGAAISEKEFDSAEKQYFPQPGDKPDVIKQKALNRRAAVEAMAREGGGSYVPKFIYGDSGRLQPYTPAQPAAAAPRASSAGAAQMVGSIADVPEGRRFRGPDGKVYRKVNGQPVPE